MPESVPTAWHMPMKIWGAFLNFKHAEFKNINAFLFILIPEIAIPRHKSVHYTSVHYAQPARLS
jgi:hypothetical protein